MKNYLFDKISPKLSLDFQYDDIVDYQSKIEYAQYFIAINEEIPNVVVFYDNFNAEKLFELIKTEYQLGIDDMCIYRRFDKKEDRIKLSGFFIHFRDDFLCYFDEDDNELRILHGANVKDEEINKVIELVKKTVEEPKAESKIFLLYENQKSLYLRDFEVKKNELDIKTNYNNDFEPIHKLIDKRLNTTDDKGLILLYGTPGTGKTSYIRYLTSLINKRMIYIPPEYAYKIASPDFLPLLISNPNSVLIIEDAEEIIEARESGRNVSVSNLLNLADGLLSDCLNIQIICTFNTHISKIDTALLRKGRLIATYEFKALEAKKAQELSTKLGFSTKIEKTMTLADIYNQQEMEFAHEKTLKIGF